MTPLYQDSVGPSRHIYAYSQEMGASATRPPQNPLLSVPAGAPAIGTMREHPPTPGPKEALSQPQHYPRLAPDLCSRTGQAAG